MQSASDKHKRGGGAKAPGVGGGFGLGVVGLGALQGIGGGDAEGDGGVHEHGGLWGALAHGIAGADKFRVRTLLLEPNAFCQSSQSFVRQLVIGRKGGGDAVSATEDQDVWPCKAVGDPPQNWVAAFALVG